MTQGIHQLAANMVNQLNRVDTISNNIANVNTVGFKEERLSEGTFNHYLEKAEKEKKEVSTLSSIMNDIPKIDNNYVNPELGSLTQTGNNLDFALNQKDKYFKVKIDNGEVQLTRNGQFKILNGHLVNQNGNQILDNNNEPITVENDLFRDKIAIVSTDFSNLDKFGNNNYKVLNESNVTNIDDNTPYIEQGFIERSNVNAITSMIGLIDAQRRFEQAQKAISGINDLDKKVISDVGTSR